ncbi:hypothetical protein RBB50_010899 [Rhinocladiella similis]
MQATFNQQPLFDIPDQGVQRGHQLDSSLSGFQSGSGIGQFKNKGDCDRHVREVHTRPKVYLCPLHTCPRSLVGNGFGRMHQLVDHLKSSKHSMTLDDARMEAHRHNINRNVDVNVNINGAATQH